MTKRYDLLAIGIGTGASVAASRCGSTGVERGGDRPLALRWHLRAGRLRSEKGTGRRGGSNRPCSSNAPRGHRGWMVALFASADRIIAY